MPARILFYIVELTATGGGQHAITLLSEQLVRRGHDVAVVTRPPFRAEHPYNRRLKAIGVPTHVLRRYSASATARSLAATAALLGCLPLGWLKGRTATQARAILRAAVLGVFARVERRAATRLMRGLISAAGRPTILHIWGPAAQTPLLLEWAAHAGVPALYHEMGEADEAYVETWQLTGTVEALAKARLVICSSPRVAEEVRRTYGYEGRTVPIPFMVNDPGPDWRRAARTGGVFTIGAIGRLVPHKRHVDLIDAIAALGREGVDARLVIAGHGPHRPEIEQHARAAGVADRVTFTGAFTSLDDVMPLFDVFALVSSSESQCMPIVESASYGKPAVIADSGGMPDFVEDGVTGFVVPLGDIAALTGALSRLARDAGLRASMGEAARARYEARYRLDRLTDAIESVYAEIATGSPA